MTQPQEVVLTLEPDVVERLMREPLVRDVSYQQKEAYPLSDFLNDQIRKVRTQAESIEHHRRQMIRAGKQLGFPGYEEL